MGRRNSILQKHLLHREWPNMRGGGLSFSHVPAISLWDLPLPLFQLVKIAWKPWPGTHFVCLGGKSQVTNLDRSACVCV